MDIARSPHQVSEAEIILTHALPLSCANSRASWRRCAREDKLLRDASSPNAKVVNFDAELADVKVSAFEKWRLRQRAELGEALGARRRALRSGAKPRSCRRTCRTQCRESVSPTPERVRKAEASRQTSEVGAVCRKAARTVLCGGRPVMGVPTAIASSDYAGVGVLRSTWAVLTLRRRDPDWNATKRRRDSERRASTAAE